MSSAICHGCVSCSRTEDVGIDELVAEFALRVMLSNEGAVVGEFGVEAV